ncbi:hypothetical protein ELUMI_v1c08120 [Williamsoniiplasma luminosum]|uniref:Uncharacterized protein n=1 Tax=Williamsoniiplasma luminosum TaxID=214888 RepID=A0A2K8NY13_9MOLU|nr:hypothetical protein [Williamsoniiplasma luminosum]ATZ17533.1 hypothetical protein ELUMI_v1c08120 [Williamsoniiplasma luminosum]
MNIKKRRLINFYWGLISLIVVFGIVLVSILSKNSTSWSWKTDGAILVALDFAIFWAFYLIMTSFKKTKYPFLTAHPQDFERGWMQAIAWYKWLWIIVLPIIAAAIVPIFYAISVAMTGMNVSTGQILVYIFVPILISINNIVYSIIITRSVKHLETTGEFELKNR